MTNQPTLVFAKVQVPSRVLDRLEELVAGKEGELYDLVRQVLAGKQSHTKLLSPREAEVAKLVLAGCRNKEIAEELNISEKTVKNHLGTVFEKLDVVSRLELLVFLLGRGKELASENSENMAEAAEPETERDFLAKVTNLRTITRALSDREQAVVHLVATGLRNKEIAQRLLISEQTVKNHLHNIFDKLGMSNRYELAQMALHAGLNKHSATEDSQDWDILLGNVDTLFRD